MNRTSSVGHHAAAAAQRNYSRAANGTLTAAAIFANATLGNSTGRTSTAGNSTTGDAVRSTKKSGGTPLSPRYNGTERGHRPESEKGGHGRQHRETRRPLARGDLKSTPPTQKSQSVNATAVHTALPPRAVPANSTQLHPPSNSTGKRDDRTPHPHDRQELARQAREETAIAVSRPRRSALDTANFTRVDVEWGAHPHGWAGNVCQRAATCTPKATSALGPNAVECRTYATIDGTRCEWQQDKSLQIFNISKGAVFSADYLVTTPPGAGNVLGMDFSIEPGVDKPQFNGYEFDGFEMFKDKRGWSNLIQYINGTQLAYDHHSVLSQLIPGLNYSQSFTVKKVFTPIGNGSDFEVRYQYIQNETMVAERVLSNVTIASQQMVFYRNAWGSADSWNGVYNATPAAFLSREAYVLTPIPPDPILKPGADDTGSGSSSAGAIAGGVAAACVVLVLIGGLVYTLREARKQHKTVWELCVTHRGINIRRPVSSADALALQQMAARDSRLTQGLESAVAGGTGPQIGRRSASALSVSPLPVSHRGRRVGSTPSNTGTSGLAQHSDAASVSTLIPVGEGLPQ